MSRSRYDHFDFLDLPAELRNMVYEYLLATEEGIVQRPAHPAGGPPNPPEEPRPSISTAILLVSRQIYKEARAIFYLKNTCSLEFYHQTHHGFQLARRDKIPFVLFNNLYLMVYLKDNHVDYGNDKLDSVGHFLASLTDTLAMASELSGIDHTTKEIFLDFDNKEDYSHILEMSPENINYAFSSSSQAIWLTLQAVVAVEHMRRDLKTRAPGISLISSVEDEAPGLQYKRESSHRLRLRVPALKKQGTLVLGKNGDIETILDKHYDENEPL